MALNTPSNLGIPASNVEFSESIRPAGKYRAAPWLPVGLFDNRRNEYIVMHGGIPVAGVRPIEKTGRNAGFTDLFPASLLGDVAADAAITYTATDVSLGVINVLTGQPLTTTVTVSSLELRLALGINSTRTVGTTYDYPASSYCIGALGYRAYRFPGGDGSNANRFNHTNFAVQDQVAILCDYVLELPVESDTVVTGSATASAGDAAADTISVTMSGTPNATAGTFIVTVNGGDIRVVDGQTTVDVTITAANPTLVTFANYDLVAGDVVEVIAVDGSLVSQMYSGAPHFSVTATQSLVEVGRYVKAGLTVGSYEVWGYDEDPAEIVGQIVSIDPTQNRGGLDKVKTHYASGDLNTTRLGVNAGLYSMAGSATGGLMGNLYRAMGTAYNGVVRVNLLK